MELASHDRTRKRRLSSWAFAVVFLGFSASVVLSSSTAKDYPRVQKGSQDSINEVVREKNYTEDEIDDIISKAYDVMDGNDGIRDAKEKRNFLDRIGLKRISLDESHVLSINPAEDKKSFYINLEGGKFGTYLGRKPDGKPNYGLAGMVPAGIVEAYIANPNGK